MAEVKRFTVPKLAAGREEKTFELAYTRVDRRKGELSEVESFRCLPAMPASALRDFGATPDSAVSGMNSFIERCLADEGEVARFRRLIDRKDVLVPADMIGDIASWLIEEYTSESPLGGRGSSGNGAGITAVSSKDTAGSAQG